MISKLAPYEAKPTKRPIMAAWTQPVRTPESKLVGFVHFSLDKLDIAQPTLEDEDAEGNWRDLTLWAAGMSKHLKSVGAAAPAELKGAIRAVLLEAWDIGPDKPGPGLREGGVPLLRAKLQVNMRVLCHLERHHRPYSVKLAAKQRPNLCHFLCLVNTFAFPAIVLVPVVFLVALLPRSLWWAKAVPCLPPTTRRRRPTPRRKPTMRHRRSCTPRAAAAAAT